MPMRKDTSPQGCGRNTVVRSPHPRQRARKIVKTAEGTLPAALRAAAHHLGTEKASFGLPRASEGAQPALRSVGAVASSCCLPTPISGNAESVLETTRGCPAAMIYAPSDVSISKHLHVYRAAAAPHRGGAVIGVQLRYQRMCCTRRRVRLRARADPVAAPSRFGPSPSTRTTRPRFSIIAVELR